MCVLKLPSAAVCLLALSVPFLAGCRFTAQGQNQLGVQQFQRGNAPAAYAHFQQALQTNPRDPDAYYNLAAIYHRYAKEQNQRDYFNQAEAYYQQCLTLQPNHADGHRGYAVLLAETNRREQAFTSLQQWVAQYPTQANPRVELARLYQEFGDKTSAETYLQQAVQIDPNNPRAWAGLGKLREDNSDLSQALAHYTRSYQLNPTQPGVADRIADLARRGVYPTPSLTPPVPGSNLGTRMVNAPGPMRRF
jgi:tetratricopeptide (TPR) repeat protein